MERVLEVYISPLPANYFRRWHLLAIHLDGSIFALHGPQMLFFSSDCHFLLSNILSQAPIIGNPIKLSLSESKLVSRMVLGVDVSRGGKAMLNHQSSSNLLESHIFRNP